MRGVLAVLFSLCLAFQISVSAEEGGTRVVSSGFNGTLSSDLEVGTYSIDGDSSDGLLFDPDNDDAVELTLGTTGVLTFVNGEILSNSTNGEFLIGGGGASNNERITINFETTANRVAISDAGTGVTNINFADDLNVGFGAFDAAIQWDTAETNDSMKIITAVGSAAQSGNIIFCELADAGTDFGAAQVANTTIRIQSADATQTSDFIMLYHDQTNGVLDVGNGVLSIPTSTTWDVGTGTTQLTVDGSTGGCIMYRDTDDAGWTECDALDGTVSCSIDADGVCD